MNLTFFVLLDHPLLLLQQVHLDVLENLGLHVQRGQLRVEQVVVVLLELRLQHELVVAHTHRPHGLERVRLEVLVVQVQEEQHGLEDLVLYVNLEDNKKHIVKWTEIM